MERTCKRCESLAVEECPNCLKEFENRKDVKDMTIEERVKEFESWRYGEIYLDKIIDRLSELVGRPIFTHEIGLCWNELKEEIRTGNQPSLEEIIGVLPQEKVIILETE